MNYDEDNSSQSTFDTYVIIEFDSKCSHEIKNWLNQKIKTNAELLTQFASNSKDQEIFLYIGATTRRLLKGAEDIGIKKVYKNKTIRDFMFEDLKNFENSENIDEFLTQSERLKVIENQLNNLKHDFEVMNFNEKFVINKYDGIINQLKKMNLIHNVFPVHDKNELKRLESSWYKNIKSYSFFELIPIEKIRNYFGESVAFYFRFFEFYTKALYPYAVFGLITWLVPFSSFNRFMLFTLFNLIWNTVLVEIWKRKSSELAYSWGMFDLELNDKPRPQFRGLPSVNSITLEPELVYPREKRRMKKYFVSYPIIVLSILISFVLMIFYYWIQKATDVKFNDPDSYADMVIRMIPSIVYSAIIIPLSIVYKYVAIYLTDWENHRTESSYESNLTTKLFVFYFFNNFMTLFYEAFFDRNYQNLSNLLVSLLTVNALFNKLTEVFAPYLKKRVMKKIINKRDGDEFEKQAYTLDQYEGLYPDYVTLFEQYGYITLFSSIFPWVAFAALVNNIMEQRSDAFKFCHVSQRPFPRNTPGIGPWKRAFELLGIVSVMTNVALIALHPEVREYFKTFSDAEYVILFVFIEHGLIMLKILITTMIPDEPEAITNAKKKYRFESLQALKKERLERSMKIK